MTVENLEKQIQMLKAKLAETKRASKPVEAKLHVAKESGKMSIAVGQGFRQAYLNKAQVEFILNNADLIRGFVVELDKVETVDLSN